MKKIVMLLLSASLLLTGCGKIGEEQTQTENEAESRKMQTQNVQDVSNEPERNIFTDDCGREVEIPDTIDSIVPSGPLAQMVLYSLAPKIIVALASDWQDNATYYIPEQYRNLPVLGQIYSSADLNVEELAKANPQLIIDIGESKKSIKEDMDDLQHMTKIPAVHIEANLSSMPEAYRTLGKMLHKEEKAEELAAFCEKILQQAGDVTEKIADHKVKALYVLGEEGLNVLAKGSFHAEVIDLFTENAAEIDNPVGKGTGNEVTIEQIAFWNPDTILFAPDSIYDDVAKRDAWKSLSAISEKKYLEVPGKPYNWMGNPPSVQRYLGMIWLPAVLYPDACDYDMKAEITEYFKLFCEYDLSDNEYEELMANARIK